MHNDNDGNMSTGHANSVSDMLSRLETMVLSGSDLPLKVVRSQISSALDIIVHLTRFQDHSRGVYEISQVVGLDNGEIILQPLFQYDGNSSAQPAVLNRTDFPLYRTEKLRLSGLVLPH